MNYKTRQPFPHAAYVEGQRNFTYFDRSLTSGLTDVVIESPGDFLYVDQASTGVVSIELNMRQGGTLAPILLAAGGSIECDFSSFKLNATAQLNKSVRLIVGNGARIKGGANVNAESQTIGVVDGSLQRVLQNQSFWGFAYCQAVAAKYSTVQLLNPTDSGKNVYVESLLGFVTALSGIVIGKFNTVLAVDTGAAYPKKLDGSVGVAQCRREAQAAPPAISSSYDFLGSGTLMPPPLKLSAPIYLPPGYGLAAYATTVNVDLTMNFEWYEK